MSLTPRGHAMTRRRAAPDTGQGKSKLPGNSDALASTDAYAAGVKDVLQWLDIRLAAEELDMAAEHFGVEVHWRTAEERLRARAIERGENT